ncbi:hypothetical protein MTO96_004698 [Rhipicephalus appendiculatus]
MAVAYFEAKGISVPTVIEEQWAALLARETITVAQDQGEPEAFGEGKGGTSGGDMDDFVAKFGGDIAVEPYFSSKVHISGG